MNATTSRSMAGRAGEEVLACNLHLVWRRGRWRIRGYLTQMLWLVNEFIQTSKPKYKNCPVLSCPHFSHIVSSCLRTLPSSQRIDAHIKE